jgi:predicted metal-dependent peptidase
MLSPKVDWRRLLAAELRRAVREVTGAVDYSYRKPSRRSAVTGDVVLPALRRPVPEVAVVCDTSGSMTEDLLAMALAEVEGLLKGLGLTRQLRVLACDTAVGAAQRVSSARQVTLTGGGGTDMGAGIAASARRLRGAHRRIHTVAGWGTQGHAGGGRAARIGGAGRSGLGQGGAGTRAVIC